MIENEEQLEERLSRPPPPLVADMAALDGDVVLLGAGGKMGPSLARMAARACPDRTVIAVSRFSRAELAAGLERDGVTAVPCDLLDPAAVRRLPDAPNVVFMAGMKFGSTGAESTTWAMNAVVPAYVADRYRASRIVVFSSGNVYPFTAVGSGGASEATAPAPVGEYAQSVLARERVFEHFSRAHGTPVVHLRLNYAIDLRYGVLLDIASRVAAGSPIDLAMGHVNVLWQGDANAAALRALRLASSPPEILNVTGPETASVRRIAVRFGERLGRDPLFAGDEAPTALLSDAGKAHGLFGYPEVPLATMIDWVAHWVLTGGPTLDRPTHFEARDGRF